MRIAYLINQYPAVSHTFIRREILALERQNFDVVRIALRGWTIDLADEDDLKERARTRYVLKDGALKLMAALFRVAVTRPSRMLRALRLTWLLSRKAERPFIIHLIYLAEASRILAWLQKDGIKHLHAHFGTNSAEVAMLVHVLGGPRWSVTVHGPEEFDKARIIHLAEKLEDCAFAVAISSYGRGQLYRWLKYENWSKVHVVHCGIDREFKASAPPDVNAASRRFICVGRLCEQKAQILLVEAMARLKALGVDCDLVLAGDGHMRPDIEARIRDHGLQNRVRITGWISSRQVRDEMIAARALALPSFAEGLPVVIMEAMALRRPIVSTFVAGIPELVHPGTHGWLVPSGDIDALVQAMQTCLETPISSLHRMGTAGQQRVLARHDVDTSAAHLAKLFQAAVQKAELEYHG